MIERRLAERRAAVGSALVDIEVELRERLSAAGITATVTGREKKPYSIFAKMKRKAINFEHLSDIYGFRILVETTADCYAALGVIHTVWQSVPGRFKDHISTPKANDYRSLHTTVIGPRKQRVELQIRSHADAPRRRVRHRRARPLQGPRARASGADSRPRQPGLRLAAPDDRDAVRGRLLG